MQALNKKIPSYEAFLEDIFFELENFSFFAISVLVVYVVLFDLILEFGHYQAILIYPIVFLTGLFILKSSLSAFTVFTFLIGLYSFGIMFLLVLAILFALELSFRFLSKYFSEEAAGLLLANISHMGDAITTYIGLNRGFEEQNPLVLSVISYFGYEAIFLIKALVLPLTLAPYYLNFSNSKLFFKIVFAIGLFLTIRNFLVIQF